MFKVIWDAETGGVLLTNDAVTSGLGVAPRPVFYEELDMLRLLF